MTIRLYLMGKKGIETIKQIKTHNLLSLIQEVIIGEDKNVINDYSLEIRNFCINYGLYFLDRKQKPTKLVDYSFAISWRWLINDNSKKLIIFHVLTP